MPEPVTSELLTIRVTPNLKDAILKMAEKERRTISFMGHILLEEALEVRSKKRKSSVTQ